MPLLSHLTNFICKKYLFIIKLLFWIYLLPNSVFFHPILYLLVISVTRSVWCESRCGTACRCGWVCISETWPLYQNQRQLWQVSHFLWCSFTYAFNCLCFLMTWFCLMATGLSSVSRPLWWGTVWRSLRRAGSMTGCTVEQEFRKSMRTTWRTC